MATLKVELNQTDIMVAVQRYVEQEFGVTVTNGVKLDIKRGTVDRPGMDTSDSVTASIVVNAISPGVVYCECDTDRDDRTTNEIEANECSVCHKPFHALLSGRAD